MFYFLRFFALAFFFAASLFSTAAGSAFTSPRASWLNLFHPSGFFGAAMLNPLLSEVHKPGVIFAGQLSKREALTTDLAQRPLKPQPVACNAMVESEHLFCLDMT